MIDVIEDHRLLARCDPTREAAADRDPNPLFDLLLDPDSRPRDQLIRSLVEQQDRARVDREDLTGANEQRRQQRVELQMRESRVRQGLKLPQPVGAVDANPFCHEQSPFAALSIVNRPADPPRPPNGRRKDTLAQTRSELGVRSSPGWTRTNNPPVNSRPGWGHVRLTRAAKRRSGALRRAGSPQAGRKFGRKLSR